MESYEGKVIEVEWIDAHWIAEDSTPEDWPEDFTVYTFGLCTRDTAKSLVVSHEHDDQGVHRGVTTLPKPYIKTVRDYGYANSRDGRSNT